MENTCGVRAALEMDNYYPHGQSDNDARYIQGAAGMRTFVFNTPGPESNHVRGAPCEIKFAYKRPWLDAPDSPNDIKVARITVN